MRRRSGRRKLLNAEKFVIISLIAFFVIIVVSNYESIKITSLGILSSIHLSVEPTTNAVTTISLEPLIELGQNQYIFVEFANLGSTKLTAKIEVHVYKLESGILNLTASYYDSTVVLLPGSTTTNYNKRAMNITFRPPSTGLYYVKVRVPYEVDYPYATKVSQVWDSFLVYTTLPVTTTIAPQAPGAVPSALPVGVANARIECPDNITIIQGEYKTFDFSIKNMGDRILNNLKLYISSPTALNVTMSPKIIKSLRLNSSTLFLITVGVPYDTDEGVYTLDIDFISDELKKSKTVDVYVVSSNISQIEYLRNLILNYEYLISRVESEMYKVMLEGYDVTLANVSLNKAKSSLEIAKTYFEERDFISTKRELRNTMVYLEEAVLQIASATLYVYTPPAYYPFFLIMVEVLIAIGIFVIFYLNRRRKRRPKRLREAGGIGG